MNQVSVSLYYTKVIAPCALSQFAHTLCPERLAVLSKIQHPHAQACSLTGDLLLAEIVRAHIPQAVFPIVRKADVNGKPYLAGFPDFHFSLSHSADTVVCAVSTVPVGVDLELPRPVRSGIAARWFSVEEQRFLTENPSAFFDLWMAKEAVLKEIGCGLCGGLKQVSVCLSPTPHLTAPVFDQWHTLSRAQLSSDIAVMISTLGTDIPTITIHPTPQLSFLPTY